MTSAERAWLREWVTANAGSKTMLSITASGVIIDAIKALDATEAELDAAKGDVLRLTLERDELTAQRDAFGQKSHQLQEELNAVREAVRTETTVPSRSR